MRQILHDIRFGYRSVKSLVDTEIVEALEYNLSSDMFKIMNDEIDRRREERIKHIVDCQSLDPEATLKDRLYQAHSEYINATGEYPDLVFLPKHYNKELLAEINPYQFNGTITGGAISGLLGAEVHFWIGDHVMFGQKSDGYIL